MTSKPQDARKHFTKADDQLIRLGLPPREILLYGTIRYHARTTGICYATWATLAEEIGVKDPTTVYRLLLRLKARKLVTWKRHGRYTNEYRPLDPDIANLQGQTLQGCNVSDIANRHRAIRKKRRLAKRSIQKKPASQPSVNLVAKTANETGGLAGLLTQTWQHLPGTPGTKLLARIAETLGDTPLEQFHELLVSAQDRVRGFGLALELAREARKRWESGATITPKKPPEHQSSLAERTKALWAKRLAKGERPI
jgi:hypothetical protein